MQSSKICFWKENVRCFLLSRAQEYFVVLA